MRFVSSLSRTRLEKQSIDYEPLDPVRALSLRQNRRAVAGYEEQAERQDWSPDEDEVQTRVARARHGLKLSSCEALVTPYST